LTRSNLPRQPLMCLCPRRHSGNARRFVAGFPGGLHYAVKANPLPKVAAVAVMQGGVSGFDVASIAEMEMLRAGTWADVHLAFNHPVKSRADIDTAYGSMACAISLSITRVNLRKLKAICGTDIVVQVRIASANPDSPPSISTPSLVVTGKPQRRCCARPFARF
jgi:ornithine decarboxylase